VDYIEQTWLPQNNGTLSFLSDMPSLSTTHLHGLFFLVASFLRWGLAAPVRSANDCPGYTASNVVRSDSSITADLNLAGPACNLHSQDLNDLKFLAEWQTGMFLSSSFDCTH
jgi:alpha-glucosidase